MSLEGIDTLTDYIATHGKTLGQKAMDCLKPLHIPQVTPLPGGMDGFLRTPFEPQKHVIAASVSMMDEQGNGFVVGEMGTGKTIIGMAAVHLHAKGKPYRALVLCPDHLVGKWIREIEETIPGAICRSFGTPIKKPAGAGKGRRKGVVKDLSSTRATLKDMVGLFGKGDGRRWAKPAGPEWYVIGRDQAKWVPTSIGIGVKKRGFDGEEHEGKCGHTIKLKSIPKVDDSGRYVYDDNGRVMAASVLDKVFRCPSCGTVALARNGAALGLAELTSKGKNRSLSCEGLYMQEVVDPEGHASKTFVGDKIIPIPEKWKSAPEGRKIRTDGRVYEVRKCGEMLWNWTGKPYRWPAARIIHKKMKGCFKYLILDELHEFKSQDSGQSMAFGKLMATAKHTLAMTGTIIGGYANHLYPLMIRMTPDSLRAEGFEWGKDMPFNMAYGKVDRIVTTKVGGGDDRPSRGGGQNSMRRVSNTGTRNERIAVRPGVMPTLFGRHLIGSSVFITLEEMAEDLPGIHEYVGGQLHGDATPHYKSLYVDVAVPLDDDQQQEYNRVEKDLVDACKDLLKKGSMKLLGAMLHTLMGYPDKPYGWVHSSDVLKAAMDSGSPAPALLGQSFLKNFTHEFDSKTETLVLTRGPEADRIPLKKDGGIYWLNVTFNGKETRSLAYDTGASSISIPLGMDSEIGLSPKESDKQTQVQVASGSIVQARSTTVASVKVGKFTVKDVECIVVPPGCLGHTIGYWALPGDRKITNWVGVVTPRDLDRDTIRPKEQALIDICLKNKAVGNQCWVYCQMTGKRDVQIRLKQILEARGLRVCILRRDTVKPREREAWIEENGKHVDVMISHPKLVSTGLDLFSKSGSHNFNSIIFYETGYNLFDMSQASRRAWRIGQHKECQIYYLHYTGGMQHRCMMVMSRKKKATSDLEGDLSAEGFAAMAGQDNAQMALAKVLSEKIDPADIQRNWGKVSSGKKKPAEALLNIEWDDIMPKPGEHNPLDSLPVQQQLMAETIVAVQDRQQGEVDDGETAIPGITRAELADLLASLNDFQSTFDDFMGSPA